MLNHSKERECLHFAKIIFVSFMSVCNDFSFFKFYFIFKLHNIVLVLPNIEMNPPQVKGSYIKEAYQL